MSSIYNIMVYTLFSVNGEKENSIYKNTVVFAVFYRYWHTS